jgi:very-short-patch-repair endonuclease
MPNIAQGLRQRTTDAEQRLWARLRGQQVSDAKFRRQHPRLGYIVDFFCREVRLIVELDGGQHDPRMDVDGVRARQLRNSGCQLLRFWNNDVLADTDAVVDAIAFAIAKRRLGIAGARLALSFFGRIPSPCALSRLGEGRCSCVMSG